MVYVKGEIELKGVAVSGGIAIGPLFFLHEVKEQVPRFSIPQEEVALEIARFHKAIENARLDLHQLRKFLELEGSIEVVSIIESHITMLDDPFLLTFVEEGIERELQNAEAIFNTAIAEYEHQFSKISDQFFRQRLSDVRDLTNRVMRHLYSKERDPLAAIPEGAIVFSKELAPSDTAEMRPQRIGAFVTEVGGETSHAALIARAKGIPFVASIDVEAFVSSSGLLVIVDAEKGTIILNPGEELIESYQKRKSALPYLKSGENFTDDEILQKEGIEVCANIEGLADLTLLRGINASGIGLFRTEFLYAPTELQIVSEEAQADLYGQIVKKANGLEIVFRLFDIGGDKRAGYSKLEYNPALGRRGIRYLMHHREIMLRQIRALLRASLEGPIKILLPMISDVIEVIETKRIIELEARALERELGVHVAVPPIGSMIEVPSAALTSDAIADVCDFLSIGTNDLVQYTLASDRLNSDVSETYRPSHPSILKLIEMIVKQSADKPLSVCGEMASDVRYTETLLRLGIKSFSCAPRYIPAIQRKIKEFLTARREG